jgi:hypothetical protein
MPKWCAHTCANYQTQVCACMQRHTTLPRALSLSHTHTTECVWRACRQTTQTAHASIMIIRWRATCESNKPYDGTRTTKACSDHRGTLAMHLPFGDWRRIHVCTRCCIRACGGLTFGRPLTHHKRTLVCRATIAVRVLRTHTSNPCVPCGGRMKRACQLSVGSVCACVRAHVCACMRM